MSDQKTPRPLAERSIAVMRSLDRLGAAVSAADIRDDIGYGSDNPVRALERVRTSLEVLLKRSFVRKLGVGRWAITLVGRDALAAHDETEKLAKATA